MNRSNSLAKFALPSHFHHHYFELRYMHCIMHYTLILKHVYVRILPSVYSTDSASDRYAYLQKILPASYIFISSKYTASIISFVIEYP